MRRETVSGGHGLTVRPEDLDQLGLQVQRQLRGRLRDFRLKCLDNGVILTGRAGCYYVKQLAQHAVMNGTDVPILANEIEVS